MRIITKQPNRYIFQQSLDPCYLGIRTTVHNSSVYPKSKRAAQERLRRMPVDRICVVVDTVVEHRLVTGSTERFRPGTCGSANLDRLCKLQLLQVSIPFNAAKLSFAVTPIVSILNYTEGVVSIVSAQTGDATHVHDCIFKLAFSP